MSTDTVGLFDHGFIGTLKLRNRLVMAALQLGYAPGGFVSERLKDFYLERAKGGAGLLVVGGCAVDPLGLGGSDFLRIDDDKFVDGYRDLMDTLRPHGAKVACQLFHAGRYAFSSYTGAQSVSASAIPSRLTGETPRALETSEVKELVKKFGEGARRAKEAGFDAVEVIASTGYLIAQFLSPLTNKRDDEYGGSFENRLRFPLEILAEIRSQVGADFPVIYRLSGDDFMKGGNTLDEDKVIAQRLAEAGLDAVDVQVGWHEAGVPTVWMSVPHGAFVYLAETIKPLVKVPVITCNRISDPRMAEAIVREGKADFVAMARGLITDPYLPAKAAEGRFEDINSCLGCNQGCLDNTFTGTPTACLANPAAGREKEFALQPVAKRKTVWIIGGGPGGLEAARVAAERGHEVTLFEKSDQVGGQLNVGCVAPNKGAFAGLVRYLSTQAAKKGVNVVLNQEVNADMVLREQPDAVILAGGAVPVRPDIPGVKGANVVLAHDVLAGRVSVGRRVAIIGARGTGCDTALFLAKRGAVNAETAVFLARSGALAPERALALTGRGSEITMLRRTGKVADDIGRSVRWVVLGELSDAGVRTITGLQYEEINDRGVVIIKDGQRQLIEADTVVIATGSRSCDELHDQLTGKVAEIQLIGDAKQPRDALIAIYEGAVAGRAV